MERDDVTNGIAADPQVGKGLRIYFACPVSWVGLSICEFVMSWLFCATLFVLVGAKTKTQARELKKLFLGVAVRDGEARDWPDFSCIVLRHGVAHVSAFVMESVFGINLEENLLKLETSILLRKCWHLPGHGLNKYYLHLELLRLIDIILRASMAHKQILGIDLRQIHPETVITLPWPAEATVARSVLMTLVLNPLSLPLILAISSSNSNPFLEPYIHRTSHRGRGA